MWAGSSILQPSVGCTCCTIAIYAITGGSKVLNAKFGYDDTVKRTIAFLLF